MPVTDVSRDLDARTLTIVADFACVPKRIWEVYAVPRELERVWGPPTYPAHLHRSRPAPRRPDELLHDKP